MKSQDAALVVICLCFVAIFSLLSFNNNNNAIDNSISSSRLGETSSISSSGEVSSSIAQHGEDKNVQEAIAMQNMIPDIDMAADVMGYLPNKVTGTPINLLALGGSVTYGDEQLRQTSYARVIGNLFSPNSIVDNLAIRASGAQVPSMCVQSMVSGDIIFNDDEVVTGNKEYDLILLEFSLNGHDGLEILVSRLRKRFPSAVLVYIKLIALGGVSEYGKVGRLDYNRMSDKTIKYLVDQGVIFYNYPKYQLQQKNFFPDRKHLNHMGHEVVAQGVFELVETKVKEKKKLGDKQKSKQNIRSSGGFFSRKSIENKWGDGSDKCFFWFHGGQLPKHIENEFRVHNANINEFSKTKFAYEVTLGEEGVFEFFYEPPNSKKKKSEETDIRLIFMTKGDPTVYPKVSAAHFIYKNDKWDYVSTKPVIPPPDVNHVSQTAVVGSVQPGWNRIIINPMEKTELPFRLTGIVIGNWIQVN